MAESALLSLEDALIAVEDLLGVLQDLYYRLEHLDDLDTYGVQEALVAYLQGVLERYDALE